MVCKQPKEIHSTYHSCCYRSCCCNLHCLLVTSKLEVVAETEAEKLKKKNCNYIYFFIPKNLDFSDIEKRNWACEICGGWNWDWKSEKKNCKLFFIPKKFELFWYLKKKLRLLWKLWRLKLRLKNWKKNANIFLLQKS